MRGSATKLFNISTNMPSIVTDFKTSKWEGEEVKFININNVPLIVLESYNAFVYLFDEISLTFLYLPSIVTGNLDSFLYTQMLIFFNISLIVLES